MAKDLNSKSNKINSKSILDSLNPKGVDIYAILMFVGGITFLITLINQPERAWSSYLVSFFYFTSLALGGLFFTALQHVVRASWSVSIRRFCESLTAFLPFAFLSALVFLLFGTSLLYEWLSPEHVSHDPLLQHKAPYLNRSFLWVRWVIFFGLWLFFTRLIVGSSSKSNKEDSEIKEELKREGLKIKELKKAGTLKAKGSKAEEGATEQSKVKEGKFLLKRLRFSVIFLLIFTFSYSLFSIDALMSLEPHWFSTIFGIYTFSGLFQSTVAFIILLIVYKMKKNKELNNFINENHLHDLGKFLFTFTIFWAYIAFSQYMLIWYANLPEETVFFLSRLKGSWAYLSLFLLIFKFIVPFLVLLPRWAKRSPTHLSAVSILILIMQYIDIYWIVYPHYSKERVMISTSEVFIFIGFLGLFLFSIHRFLNRNSLVPYRDLKLKESIEHHVV